nr:FtsK/SpoIIIE domain-containing protein [uncultured Dysosmobacter sp.]
MIYHSDSNYLRYAPIQIKLAISAGCAFLIGILFAYSYNSISPAQGEMESFGELGNLLAVLSSNFCIIATFVAIILTCLSVYFCLFMPDTIRICSMIQQGLYQPSRGNPLHLRDGDLLPKISCKCVAHGVYNLTISAQQSVSVDILVDAAPVISAALNRKYQRYAVVQVDADIAFRAVTFIIEDVLIDRSITFTSSAEMQPESPTMLWVDQVTNINLTTSGSILVAGKTRSGKTTGVIALLIQALSCGPDDYGSSIVIIDPKQAELSRLPHTITLDDDGEATGILDTLKIYADTIKQRQKILNDLSEQKGDAVKWWDANFHPSFLFIDEYVACRSLFPKKAPKDSDYCLDVFDNLLKRIVTMGASAGCFTIISVAEASVQEGGLPSMLRSAMSTKILFRPTRAEGLLMWDREKLDNFVGDRVYNAGDAWFSSTDGMHDSVSFVQFPHMDFPVYRELGRLLQEYYD